MISYVEEYGTRGLIIGGFSGGPPGLQNASLRRNAELCWAYVIHHLDPEKSTEIHRNLPWTWGTYSNSAAESWLDHP